MATIKVACPKCGQKVSGDESFYGTTVECPVCSSDIRFPGQRQPDDPPHPLPVPPETPPKETPTPVPAEERPAASSPRETSAPPAAGLEPGAEVAAWSARAATDPEPAGKDKAEEDDDEDDGPDLPPSPIWGAVSIVSAVLSIVTCVGGPVFAPLAIICGHTALAKARHSPVQPAPGHTLGAIGLIIGYVSLGITILLLLALVLFQESLRGVLPWGQG